MKWQTETPAPQFPFSLSLDKPLFFLGSCFAENIGKRLQNHFLPVVVNPFGIVFNPLSLMQNVHRWKSNKPYTKNELNHHNGLYFSFDHHSRFSHPEAPEVLKKIQLSLDEANALYPTAQAVFISLGTSFYWELKSVKRIVNNCHKIPEKEFDLKMASIPQIVDALENTLSLLRDKNQKLPVIFTVSPVRHLKHGSLENQRSKARLIEAAHQICEADENAHYFPSYEFLLDDLRDYRFYERDFVHPNAQAVDYIFEKFCQSFFRESDRKTLNELHKIRLSLNHRFLTDNQAERKKFIQNLKGKILRLEEASNLDLSDAKQILSVKLGTKDLRV